MAKWTKFFHFENFIWQLTFSSPTFVFNFGFRPCEFWILAAKFSWCTNKNSDSTIRQQLSNTLILKTWCIIIEKCITMPGGSHVPFCPFLFCPFFLFTSEGYVKWGTKETKGTKTRNQILPMKGVNRRC